MKNLITEVECQLQPAIWLDKSFNPEYPNHCKNKHSVCGEEIFIYDDRFYFSETPECEIITKIVYKTGDTLLQKYQNNLKQEVLFNQFQNFRNFFELMWKPQRQKSINCLADLSEHLQNLNDKFQLGMICYSCAGIAGDIMSIIGLIGAPFTVGISLGLTVGGVVLGAISRSANIVHALINNALTQTKCIDTLTVLEKDLILTRNLLNMLEELTGSGYLHNIRKNTDSFIETDLSFSSVAKTIHILRNITAISDVEVEPITFKSILHTIKSTMTGDVTPTVSTGLSIILGLLPGIGTVYNAYNIVNSSRSLYLNKSDQVVLEVQDEIIKLADEIYDVSEIIDGMEKTVPYSK